MQWVQFPREKGKTSRFRRCTKTSTISVSLLLVNFAENFHCSSLSYDFTIDIERLTVTLLTTILDLLTSYLSHSTESRKSTTSFTFRVMTKCWLGSSSSEEWHIGEFGRWKLSYTCFSCCIVVCLCLDILRTSRNAATSVLILIMIWQLLRRLIHNRRYTLSSIII